MGLAIANGEPPGSFHGCLSSSRFLKELDDELSLLRRENFSRKWRQIKGIIENKRKKGERTIPIMNLSRNIISGARTFV